MAPNTPNTPITPNTPNTPNTPFTMQGELLTIGAKYQKSGQMQKAKITYNKFIEKTLIH